MIPLTPRDRFLSVLTGKEVDRAPVLSITQTATVEQMELAQAYWPEAHTVAEQMARLGLTAHERAGFEGVRIPFSMTAEASTMGCGVDYHGDRAGCMPSVRGPLASQSLRAAEPTEGQMGVIVEATRILRGRLGGRVPIIVGVTGPFTLTCFIRGFERTIMDLTAEPAAVHRTSVVAREVISRYCDALGGAGADAVSLLEPNASLIGPKYFDRFVLPYLREISEGLKIPAVLHICGNALPIMELMVQSGVQGISIDQKVGVARAKAIIDGRASLIGNADPVALLLGGSPADVERECRRMLREGVDILAPGCGLSPFTPIGNLRAMVRAASGGA